jgi:hypothetical protein
MSECKSCKGPCRSFHERCHACQGSMFHLDPDDVLLCLACGRPNEPVMLTEELMTLKYGKGSR